jgi:tetratricopeptide (TPR) repeat protein
LGVVLIQLGHSAEAVDAWREADSSRYWAWLSATEAEKGRNSSAYELAERATLIDPNDEETQFILGEVYYHLGDLRQAVRYLSVALKSSHEVQTWYYDALMLRGQAYMALPGNLNNAYTDLVQALRLRHLDPWPYIRLCQVFGLDHKFDSAIAACQQATHLAKDSAFAHYYLGWAFFQDSQWTAAEAAFERSLELDPNLQAAQEWLIRTHEQE